MEKNYKECLKYIENYWKKVTCHFPKDKELFIGLPNRFVSPNTPWLKNYQFYWDSYFVILGLTVSGKINLAKGIVNNFIYLYKKFGIIPMANKFYYLGNSQPSFLTSMIREVFKFTKDKEWLKETMKVAESELEKYWRGKDHLSCDGLSQYYHPLDLHSLAEVESGWDMTSRFKNECLDYLPIDLNSCLYKYEMDIADTYKFLNNKSKEKEFLARAKKRKGIISKLMWNKEKSFFFDYNHRIKKQGDFYSVAGFYPLWAKLVSKAQAKRVKEKLKIFECEGGLANTQKSGLAKEFKQWDYPNGWPNQQWIVIKGLLNYGFEEDAKRIAIKWLNLNEKVFQETGMFWEKYDVVKLSVGKSGRYSTASGFSWTNAVFVKLIDESCISKN